MCFPSVVEKKVESACVACRQAHARCSHVRPCHRCRKLGIICKPRNCKKKRYYKNKLITYLNSYSEMTGVQKLLVPNVKQVKLHESLLELLLKDDSEAVEDYLTPLECNLERMCPKRCDVIVCLYNEFPKFKICSPSLLERFGYSMHDEMSLYDLLSPADYWELVQELRDTIMERRQFQAINGPTALLKFCMETSKIERKLLFSKTGEITECVVKSVMSFSKRNPSELESFTMYIFFP